MYTIYDYLKCYKNTSLQDVKWNIIDNLLCSILAYMPNKPFAEEISLDELLNRIDDTILEPDTWLMAPKVKDITRYLRNAKRYKDMIISRFEKEITDEAQFAAVTITIGNIRVISFEGSDGTVTGWRENLRLAYMYPLKSQILACEYVNSTELNGYEVYLVGHSKGGNLAMAACYEASDEVYNNIKEVDNFDGPGFLKEQFTSPKFTRLSKKLVNVVPVGSYIGVLLYNNSRYINVNSNESGALVHYPTSWEVFGTCFIKSKMKGLSKYIYNITTKGFDELNREQTGKVVEAVFTENFKSYDSKMRMNIKQVKKAFDNAKANDIGFLKIARECLGILTIEQSIKRKTRKNKKKIEAEA